MLNTITTLLQDCLCDEEAAHIPGAIEAYTSMQQKFEAAKLGGLAALQVLVF